MKKTALILVIMSAGLLLISTGALADKGGKINFDGQPADSRSITPVDPIETQGQEINETDKNPAAGEEINWQVLSAGGITNCSGGGYRLGGTLGQLAGGVSSTTGHDLHHGFWQSFGASDCDCFPGDANSDDVINVGDAVYIINFVFREGAPAIPYDLCSGDAQADCFCNVGDAVYVINYVFRDGDYTFPCETWVENCGPVIYK